MKGEYDIETRQRPLPLRWCILPSHSFHSEANLTHAPAPCQRSLHCCVIFDSLFYIFGGYDGSRRVNDFYSYDIKLPPNKTGWKHVKHSGGTPPSPRDRHIGVTSNGVFYVFGGFDGTSRVNDLHAFDFRSSTWVQLLGSNRHDESRPVAPPPSPRHSHSAVVYKNNIYIFSGYDGSYKNDLHCYDTAGDHWEKIVGTGRIPKARYRSACIAARDSMYVFGGHDGNRHLNDVHTFDFSMRVWSSLSCEGVPPSARDSHVAVFHGNSSKWRFAACFRKEIRGSM